MRKARERAKSGEKEREESKGKAGKAQEKRERTNRRAGQEDQGGQTEEQSKEVRGVPNTIGQEG